MVRCAIWYHLYNLKKPATLLKLTLLHGCFSRFLNCTNGTKSRNASHISRYKYNHEGREVKKNVLNSVSQKLITMTVFIRSLLLLLKNFTFNGICYLQKIGCGTGTTRAPNYANILTGKLEKNIFIQT